MSALTRFDPMDEFFPELFRRLARPFDVDTTTTAGDIRLDVSETDKEYTVSADLPGVRKDDIRVAIDRNVVTISTRTSQDAESRPADGGRMLIRESWRGEAMRSFALEHEVDDKAATAKLEHGVLRLTLPKRAGTASRLIAVE